MSQLKLTTRGHYAVMAMVELAKTAQDQPAPLSNIADKSNISLSYLEQLIAGLRRHNLVKSHRGPGGGYLLARPASEIIVADILIAAEDNEPAKRGAANKRQPHSCERTHVLWKHIGRQLYDFLKDISLADVLHGKMEQKAN